MQDVVPASRKSVSPFFTREAARAAIQLNPSNPEPHFWLAESLRLSGAFDKGAAEYAVYLRLSDFDSKLAGKMNYYVLGYLAGFGKKKRAAQQDIWKDLRSLAYFGICDCQRKLSNWDTAIENCQKALSYTPDDPYVRLSSGWHWWRKFATIPMSRIYSGCDHWTDPIDPFRNGREFRRHRVRPRSKHRHTYAGALRCQ